MHAIHLGKWIEYRKTLEIVRTNQVFQDVYTGIHYVHERIRFLCDQFAGRKL